MIKLQKSNLIGVSEVTFFVRDVREATWWIQEERYGVHAFTVVTAYAALRSASRIADTFGDASIPPRSFRWLRIMKSDLL